MRYEISVFLWNLYFNAALVALGASQAHVTFGYILAFVHADVLLELAAFYEVHVLARLALPVEYLIFVDGLRFPVVVILSEYVRPNDRELRAVSYLVDLVLNSVLLDFCDSSQEACPVECSKVAVSDAFDGR